ncbi:MAG TPA: STAS domain-containing protein, partial [Candidatus Dormibacteraeota bacterium]|nr:STAS domain-containing protein [Candidatus Dormibacteraeota bacterium]
MNLSIDTVKENNQMIVHVSGEVDIYTAPDLKKQLLELTKQEGQSVVVDLSHVNYMD